MQQSSAFDPGGGYMMSSSTDGTFGNSWPSNAFGYGYSEFGYGFPGESQYGYPSLEGFMGQSQGRRHVYGFAYSSSVISDAVENNGYFH